MTTVQWNPKHRRSLRQLYIRWFVIFTRKKPQRLSNWNWGQRYLKHLKRPEKIFAFPNSIFIEYWAIIF
jgi:hypothetical protein